MTDHEQYRRWTAAYVLGALESGERVEFEKHIETCAVCTSEIASFAPIPGLLARVDLEPPVEAPQRIAEEAISRIRSDWTDIARSRGRWRAAAVVASIAVFTLVLVVGSTLGTRDGTDGMAIPLDEGSLATGSITLEARIWGSAVELKLADLPVSDTYVAWAVSRSGERELIATWGPTPSRAAAVSGASSIQLKDLAFIVVTTGPDAGTVTVGTASPLEN